MKTSEFIKGREEEILSHYGYQVTGNRHVDCPICGGKKKMRINWHQGSLSTICVCGSRSLLSFLVEANSADYATIARQIDETFGNVRSDQHRETRREDTKAEKAVKLYRCLDPVFGSIGMKYLNSRGISQMPVQGIRCGAVFNAELNQHIPALFALCAQGNQPTFTHTTYITESGKANVPVQKKMQALTDYEGANGAVRLFPLQETLAISEGIESALSYAQIEKAATWAALNSSLLKKFRAPDGVKRLIIAADNDRNAAGLAAAFECAHRNVLANNDVEQAIVRWSSAGDFNDHLLNGGDIYEWRASK